jgi:hypothetical protein
MRPGARRTSCAQDACVSHAVAVSPLALLHVHDGVEAAVRVQRRAWKLARRIVHGPELVEEQELARRNGRGALRALGRTLGVCARGPQCHTHRVCLLVAQLRPTCAQKTASLRERPHAARARPLAAHAGRLGARTRGRAPSYAPPFAPMGRRTTKPPPSRYFLAWKLLSTRLSGDIAAIVDERARGSRRHAGAAAARAARSSARAAVSGSARAWLEEQKRERRWVLLRC